MEGRLWFKARGILMLPPGAVSRFVWASVLCEAHNLLLLLLPLAKEGMLAT